MQKSTARKLCSVDPARMAMQQRCPDWTTLRPPAFRYYRRGLNSALTTLADAHERPSFVPLVALGETHTDFRCARKGWRPVMALHVVFTIRPMSAAGRT